MTETTTFLKLDDQWTDDETVPASPQGNNKTDRDISTRPDWWTQMCIQGAQQTDEAVSLIYRALEASTEQPPKEQTTDWPHLARILWYNWHRLRIQDGILRYHWENADGTCASWPFVVPAKYRYGEFWRQHVDQDGKHRSRDEVLELMEMNVYWPRWQKDVISWMRLCQHCRDARLKVLPVQQLPDREVTQRKSAAVQTDDVLLEDEDLEPISDLRIPTMIFWSNKYRARYLNNVVQQLEERVLRDRGRMQKPARFRE